MEQFLHHTSCTLNVCICGLDKTQPPPAPPRFNIDVVSRVGGALQDMRRGQVRKANDCTHTQHNIDARGGGMRKLNRYIETKQMITLNVPWVKKSN